MTNPDQYGYSITRFVVSWQDDSESFAKNYLLGRENCYMKENIENSYLEHIQRVKQLGECFLMDDTSARYG